VCCFFIDIYPTVPPWGDTHIVVILLVIPSRSYYYFRVLISKYRIKGDDDSLDELDCCEYKDVEYELSEDDEKREGE